MKQYNVAYRKVLPNGAGTFTPTIGTAFEHEKGHITIRLDAMPLRQFWRDGELILFAVKEEQ